MFVYSFFSCVTGYILDMIFGDPDFLYHPVRLMGYLIAFMEKMLRRIFKNSLILAGIILVILVVCVSVAAVAVPLYFLYKYNAHAGYVFESIVCYFMLAAKSLKTESMKVYDRVAEGDLAGARRAVSMIVGRDTEKLSLEGVIKAAVETVAENLSDGVIAPLFYMFLGGGVAGVFYKCINTMDSMVGYKNEKYLYFGRAAAKLDDVVNFIPARLSALFLIMAAFFCKKDYKNGVRIFIRDRYKHASPNSAQTEAACAGVLNIRLAGNAYYFGKLYEKPFIGDEGEIINKEHIKDVNKLMYAAAFLFVVAAGVVTGIV